MFKSQEHVLSFPVRDFHRNIRERFQHFGLQFSVLKVMFFRAEYLDETRKSDENVQSFLTCNVDTSQNKNTEMIIKTELGQQHFFSSQNTLECCQLETQSMLCHSNNRIIL